jgi:hypothetical protein
MSGLIFRDQMKIQSRRDSGIDIIEKPNKLPVPEPRPAIVDHFYTPLLHAAVLRSS